MPIAMLNPPRKEYVPPSPIASIICGANKGMANASSERASEAAASAAAEYLNASMKYSCSGSNMDIMPNPKMDDPMMGSIQC